jgi:hypothetical protein
MVHEIQETDAVLRQLRGVENAVEDLIVEVGVGLQRSSLLHEKYFKLQVRYQRIVAATLIVAAMFLLTMLTVDVVHEW